MSKTAESGSRAAKAGGPTQRKKAGAASRLDEARTRMYEELIFESAECVFGEKGFEGATMQDIASEAGVSLKTVYASFPGKRELFGAIMTRRGEAMMAAVEDARSRVSEPVERLVVGIRAFVQFLFDHRDWMRIHSRSRLSWAIRPEDEGAGRLWDAGQRSHSELLREGIASGVFLDDDPAETALMIQAITRVQVAHAMAEGEADPDAVSDRLVRRILRMVCTDAIALREVG